MADSFQLRVVTPRRELLDEQVSEVTAPGTVGEFGVLPEHITFLSSLEVGEFTYKTAGAERTFIVRGGFAEVSDDVMTVLAADAAFADEVDVDAARREGAEAEAALADLSPLDPDYTAREADRRWAEARIAIAGKR